MIKIDIESENVISLNIIFSDKRSTRASKSRKISSHMQENLALDVPDVTGSRRAGGGSILRMNPGSLAP